MRNFFIATVFVLASGLFFNSSSNNDATPLTTTFNQTEGKANSLSEYTVSGRMPF